MRLSFSCAFFSASGLLIISLLLVVAGRVLADPEEVPQHDEKNASEKQRHHRNFEDEHYEGKDHAHNAEADRKVIFGSEKAVHQFDDLTPDESKKRLRAIAKRMDTNSDGYVSVEELTEYVRRSMMSLDAEETKERFDEIDSDKDSAITWDEYVRETFNVQAETFVVDREDKKLLEEDRRYFKAADVNGDGKMTYDEFGAFQNPESHSHMHDVLIENTLSEKDENKDGKIDLTEFMGGEANMGGDTEWFNSEKKRFQEEYDKDKDGKLAGEELRAWLVPDLTTQARQEADHLITQSDNDKDGRLSLDEVVDGHKHFVGSEATNYGEHLLDVRHEEL